MDNEIEATLKRLEANHRRQETTLNALESRISIIHDGMRKALEGLSRLKLQLHNVKTRSQKQEATLERLAAGVDRIERTLACVIADAKTDSGAGSGGGRDK
ncbi:MAG: hypothetical protein ACE5FO_09250 [Parvularculaceae bacterium]